MVTIMIMRTVMTIKVMVMVTAGMVNNCRGNKFCTPSVDQAQTTWRPSRGWAEVGPTPCRVSTWSTPALHLVYTWIPTAAADHHHCHHHHHSGPHRPHHHHHHHQKNQLFNALIVNWIRMENEDQLVAKGADQV